MLLQIVQNITLITALAAIYSIFPQLSYKRNPRFILANGLIFGLVAIIAMSMPYVAEEGLIYDGRSIVVALAGIFAAPLSALLAALIAAVFRAFAIGGAGTIPGILTIFEATGIGVLMHHWNDKHKITLGFSSLLFFGLVIHLLMLAAQLTLPNERWRTVIPAIAPAVLTLYPVGLALTGTLFVQNKKHIEEHFQLKESESRYRSIFENHHTIMLISDPDTGSIFDANPAAIEFYGWSKSQMLHMNQSDLRASSPESFYDSPATGSNTGEALNVLHRLRSGEIREVAVFSGPIEYAGRTLTFSIVQDTTEQRKAERLVRQLNQTLEQKVKDRTQELEQANKELKAFAYSVSHDLRAPLRAIEGFSSLLRENVAGHLDGTSLHYLDRIVYNSEKMGTLIDALLRLSRVTSQPIVFTNVDLSAIAKETISELQQTEPERHVEVIIQDGLTARADAALIRILLSNLLGNAWKFTSKAQVASIRFEASQSNTAERVFVVSDNGVGFDMAYADKLFSPFQRLHTETEFPGTGIGLSLVQRIIIRHGGKIWAKASPSRGAQFFFTLGDGNEQVNI